MYLYAPILLATNLISVLDEQHDDTLTLLEVFRVGAKSRPQQPPPKYCAVLRQVPSSVPDLDIHSINLR